METTTMWAVLMTVTTSIFGYLNYRKSEVISMVMDLIDAYKDKVIDQTEYNKLTEDLEQILYKK